MDFILEVHNEKEMETALKYDGGILESIIEILRLYRISK